MDIPGPTGKAVPVLEVYLLTLPFHKTGWASPFCPYHEEIDANCGVFWNMIVP